MSASGQIVLDASAMVDILVQDDRAAAVTTRIAPTVIHVPARFDVGVLSASGRPNRAGEVTDAETAVGRSVCAPMTRHPLANPTRGAWHRRAGDVRPAAEELGQSTW
ncbi:hypothetical protein [Nocardia brevicatena]|uniref:hypothetical protein n=1 Tax=Nocardia brevicatena TaxID=37327 RepID=UPI0002D98E06|nr:hypothetical protein [Nocardia brevicatena]